MGVVAATALRYWDITRVRRRIGGAAECCRLFLVLPQEGSGDLSRDPEDEVEVEVPSPVARPVGTTGLLSSAAFASDL